MRGNSRIAVAGACRLRIGVALLVLLTAGCTPHISNWSPSNGPRENKVAWVSFDHVIEFAPGATALTRQSREELVRFLRDHGAKHSDHILLGSAGRLVDGRAATLADRRWAAVATFLRRNSVFPRALPDTPSRRAWNGTMTLVIGRYVVTPPNCPDWSKSATGDPANRPSSNFGCATTTNLGLMVADPGDLLRGTPAGPGDGEAAGRAIERYRKGELKTPQKTTPETTK